MFNFSTPLLKPMLVLEDDPTQQLRISKLLQAFGYEEKDIFYSQTIDFAVDICSNQYAGNHTDTHVNPELGASEY